MLRQAFFHGRFFVLYFARNFIFEESVIQMAKNTKRREPKKQMPKRSAHDQIYHRKRSTAEKVMLVLGIVIALSMLLSLVVSLGGSSF